MVKRKIKKKTTLFYCTAPSVHRNHRSKNEKKMQPEKLLWFFCTEKQILKISATLLSHLWMAKGSF